LALHATYGPRHAAASATPEAASARIPAE
jgi:hypothetical protein